MNKFSEDLTSGGKQFTVSSGVIAKQAGGAVMVHAGGLALLCCATGTREPREGVDFFPLMCDYEERFYAAGKFPGGFIKREGRPSDVAVLSARKIDRTIRPIFPDDFRNEVQVVVTALSQDNDTVPDIYAINGSSIALALSNIPYPTPVAAVRVGLIDGEFIINPTFSQKEQSSLDLLVSGTRDRINMIEDESREVPLDKLIEALRLAKDEVTRLCDAIIELGRKYGKEKMQYNAPPELSPELQQRVAQLAEPKISAVIPADSKQDLFVELDRIRLEVVAAIVAEQPEADVKMVAAYLGKLTKKYARKKTLEGVRVDGRGFEEIREISGMVDFLPRVHGSALFTRGQTQVVSAVTLGSGGDRQRIDTVNFDSVKRYVHHYNFPPYSVGEVRFMRGAGRREVGHGYLAEKAVEPVLPAEEVFPYSIRVVSEVTESNASSSMASTCGSTMALMAAGVPIIRPVGGISIGLVTEGDKYKLLMDLSGFEDFNGDMDFKVTGTSEGVTAIQLDVKIEGLTMAMVEETLRLAERGYLAVIEEMKKVIPAPRESISEMAPLLELIQIDVDQIGMVIGPSGKTIKKICADTGAEIDIDEDGKVFVSGTDHEGVKKALSIIRAMTSSIEEGNEYSGTVVRIMPFGAFIELVPGRDGFLHISGVAERRIEKVEDVLSVGDKVPVRVREIDQQGKINLMRTDIAPPPPRREGGGRDGERREGGGGGGGYRGDRGGGRPGGGGRDGGGGRPGGGGRDGGGRPGGGGGGGRDDRYGRR